MTPARPPSASDHVHGPDCDHDHGPVADRGRSGSHAHSHAHSHGPDCDHDHDHDHGPIAEPYVRAEAKVSRNDPCPCGSGKKYKKCHDPNG